MRSIAVTAIPARLRHAGDALTIAACFGFVPTLTPSSPVLTATVVIACAIVIRRPQYRFVVIAFGCVELIGTPWPAACYVAFAAFVAWNPPSIAAIFEQVGGKTLGYRAWLGAIGVGIFSGYFVVLLDAKRITDGYTFGTPIPAVALLPLLPVVAIALAAVNALGEELLWRGILIDASTSSTRPLLAACMQGASFGIAHYFGIPFGLPGVISAGAYAVVIYWIAVRVGLRAAVLTHFFTDLIIFLAVLQHARFEWSG